MVCNNFLLLYSPIQYSVVNRKIAHKPTGKIIGRESNREKIFQS